MPAQPTLFPATKETERETVKRKIAEYYARKQAMGLDGVTDEAWLTDEGEGITHDKKACWLCRKRVPQNEMFAISGKDVCDPCARDMVRVGYTQDE